MNQATKDFILQNADADVRQLALRGAKDPDVDLACALDQIAGRQKARTKLPSWAAVDGIVYPPHLSMEQCSSEPTARYKAGIVERLDIGKDYFVDLTGGFGVDFSFLAENFKNSVYVERQPLLCDIVSDNLHLLGISATVQNADAVDYLHTLSHTDLIFLDPARRDEHGARTYGIADCTPNILEILSELMEKTRWLMLKLSPMLDWQKTVDDIQQSGCAKVSEVHIVSVDNECKELLLVVSKEVSQLKVFCVNNGNVFSYDATKQTAATPSVEPKLGQYLYEPNASVMKAGCFHLLESHFSIAQLDPNSHLFTSDEAIPDFPGRQFAIERVSSLNKRDLKTALQGIDKANITVRNFPMSVAELRKRLKLKDGGEVFIFATTIVNDGHKLLICRKKA